MADKWYRYSHLMHSVAAFTTLQRGFSVLASRVRLQHPTAATITTQWRETT